MIFVWENLSNTPRMIKTARRDNSNPELHLLGVATQHLRIQLARNVSGHHGQWTNETHQDKHKAVDSLSQSPAHGGAS